MRMLAGNWTKWASVLATSAATDGVPALEPGPERYKKNENVDRQEGLWPTRMGHIDSNHHSFLLEQPFHGVGIELFTWISGSTEVSIAVVLTA